MVITNAADDSLIFVFVLLCPTTGAGYNGFLLAVPVSVHLAYVCSSVVDTYGHPYFPFWMMSKYQWIFTKLDMCIDIVEISFGIANGRISSVLYSDLPAIVI